MAVVEIPDSLRDRCQVAAEVMGTTLELWLINVLTTDAESDIEDEESHGSLEGWTPGQEG